ncbi:MAG: hypothetical protein ACI4OR_02080 [Alphaproteobacteria bacterium]
MDMNNMPPHAPKSAQAQPPTNPSTNVGSKNTDLYSAIAKDDEEIIMTPKKKRQSPFMGLVVLFMKVTFYFDSVRRTHESFFHFLGGLWAGFMGLIYLGGLITLFLSIYARARLPLYLENFFESHNLKYDSLKMADYSLSRIKVTNLHDEGNQYVIPQLNVHSTFADFLQGRIRTLTADGLQLNLKSAKANGESLENILSVLGMIANPMEAGLDLKINSITINNAVLNIEGADTKIPVNFSMSGLYTHNAQVIIPFTVNEEFLKMDASLSVSGQAQDRRLDLTIKSGTLALANRPPEELQGNVVIQTASDKITSVKSQINLNYGYSLKTIEADLENSEKGFKGNLSFLLKNTSEKEAKPLADLTFTVDELLITKDGFISTSAPLQMKINRLVRNTTLLEGVGGTLNGDLQCSFTSSKCQYDLTQEATLQYQNLAVRYKDQNIVINESGNLLFMPSSNTLILELTDSKIGLNWHLSDVILSGFYNTPTNTLLLKADTCQLNGSFSTQIHQDSFDVEIMNGFYQTPNLTMKGIDLTAQDLYNPTAPIRFSADEITTSSALLKQPVSVEMTYLNRQVKANVRVKETDISLMAEGVFQPFQKTFIGQFKMPSVDLKNLPFTLFDLSSVFPKSLTEVSGQVVAAGQLHFAGVANIAGPLYLGLQDVNFKAKDVAVGPVNGVVALQSLLPLVSAPNQNLFIGKIDTLAPLTNINASFQLENQALRLLAMTAGLGSETLSLSSALIPYRKPNALLYLKTDKDFDIAKMTPYLNLTGTTPVGGTGSLAIPVDISEEGIELSSVSLKVNNVTLRQVADKPDVVGLFQQGNNAYMIRTGQLVLDKDHFLQVDLDGWLMPMRKREAFTQNDIQLDKPLFKSGKESPVPAKIQDRQKLLFQMLTDAGQ